MSLKKNVIANFVGQGWTALMGIAFIPLYIKYLGVEAYGLIGFFAVMQAWFTLLDMGITQTLNREMARYTSGVRSLESLWDLLRSLEVLALVIAILISLVVWQLSEYFSEHWLNAKKMSYAELSQAITLVGVVIALRFIEGIYKGALLGLQKQVLVNIISIVIATMRYGGVVAVLAWYASSIKVFFIWQALSSIISVLLLVYFLYRSLPKTTTIPKFNLGAILDVWRFASGMLSITFLALLLTQIDKVLLSKLIALEDYGYYTLASTIAASLGLIAIPVTQAVYPKLVENVAQNKLPELTHFFHQGAQLISILVAPIAMMLIFFGNDIIFLWSGDLELANKTSPILIPLALGSFLNCLVWMPYQLQLAYGWTGFAIKINSVAVALLVPTIFIVAPKYGALGVAWIWALLNFGYVTLGMHVMYKKILCNEKWSWYLNDTTNQALIAFFFIGSISLLVDSLLLSEISKVVFLAFLYVLTVLLVITQSNQIRPLINAKLNLFK